MADNIFTRLISGRTSKKAESKEKIEEKITTPPVKSGSTEVSDHIVSNVETSSIGLLEGIDVATEDEDKLIQLYRDMENDAVISAALDLYADSATQVNPKTGHVVSIESVNKTFENEINEFLWKKVKLDTEAWQMVRDVARDGKIFLDTMVDKTDWSFVPVLHPANVKALTLGQDKIKYFVVAPEKKKEQDDKAFSFTYYKDAKDNAEYAVTDKDRFIAGFNSRETRGTMTISTKSQYTEEESTEELTIRSGRSILANVVQTFQTLSALEDAMFINRLTKSTEFKIVTIDVGEGTNNKQAKQIMDSVKNAFKSSETIDKVSERYHNRQSPIPVNDWIYVPIKGNKGTVTIDTIGGEQVEAKTGDIDYYRNKLFAGLGVLKAYLGFEETTPGGLGDSTLTKLDERYGKRVIRLQQVLVHMVKQMISFYWRYSVASETRKEDNIPEYKVILGKVSTKEEEENRKRLQDSLNIAEQIVSMTKDEYFSDLIDPEKLFKYVFEDVIGIETSAFSREPVAEEIPLQVHKISESIKSLKRKRSYKPNDLLSNVKTKDLKEMFEEYDIYLDLGNETIPFRIGHNLNRYNKHLLAEKTYKQLKDASKQKDPVRLAKSKKITAKYTGLDKNNYITFRMTAEDPAKNAAEGKPTSYTVKASLKDLAYLINAAKEDEGDITDKDLVMLAMQGDVAVSCTCPAAKYWGMQWNGTKQDYSIVKNDIAPTRNVPTQVVCKHTIQMLTVLPFWYNTIVRDLRRKGLLGSSETTEDKVDDKTKDLKDDEEIEEIENIEDLNNGETKVTESKLTK